LRRANLLPSFSRIYRIGQASNVEVRRFVIKDAIDTQLLLRLQERKNKEIMRVMGDTRQARKLSIQDLMKLFGPLKYDEETGQPLVEEDEDVEDEFIFAEDQYVQDDSDAEAPGVVPRRPW